jgi:hypothetical protein
MEQLSAALDVPTYILFFKAMQEENIQNPDNKRFVREIKRAMQGIVDELYAQKA